MTQESDRLVLIASAYSRPELYVLLSFLRGHGIFAATIGEGQPVSTGRCWSHSAG